MSDSNDKAERIERLRAIVNDDFDRISGTEDPFRILNVGADVTWDEAAAMYDRFERFYRPENFQKLGDMELTRRALDVRRSVGRAIVEIQARLGADAAAAAGVEIDPDGRAMGDIYFRDGLTYLRLGDVDAAAEVFRRAADYDPGRGLILAYLAYTAHRQRPHDPAAIDECRVHMRRALELEPDGVDVQLLAARLFVKTGDFDAAARSIDAVRAIDPRHPKIGTLEDRLARARTNASG